MLSGKKWKKINEYTLIPFPSPPTKKAERKKKKKIEKGFLMLWKKRFGKDAKRKISVISRGGTA